MHLKIITVIIDVIFAAGLFVNAALFVPQSIKLYKCKNSEEVSLLTFIGFCVTQVAAIAYGVINNDYILTLGFLLSLISCGITTYLIIYYRKKSTSV